MSLLIIIRSFFFNLLFFGWSIFISLAMVPFVFFGKKVTMFIMFLYLKVVYFLEKYVAGIDYEVRGRQYLPDEGPYLIAAKHQSAYETLKLHYLFHDPAIILKRELIQIPIWGRFLANLDIIAINRRNKEESMSSLIDGARRMKDQKRPIVIFPQGTRVKVEVSAKEKPYKGGIIKMYNATELPIIPMALNSGLFWARNSFIKRPGTVVFEFLPPIEPGLPEKKVMKALEERIEETTIRLMDEAKEKNKALKDIKTQALLT